MGIGTNAPSFEFEIRKASGFSIAQIGESSSIGGQLQWDATANVFSIQTNAYAHAINIGNNWMNFQPSGNVGIGTSSPARRLDVASDGINWISGVFAGQGGADKVVIGNLAGFATIGAHDAGLSTWSHLVLQRDGGNVGIGTSTAPLNKLNLNGGMAIGVYAAANTAPANGLIVSGQVGINTSTPLGSAALDVNGLINSSNFIQINKVNTQEYRFNGGSGNQWRIISSINGATNGNLVFNNTTDNFGTVFVNPLILTPTGNVGINFTNPLASLSVSRGTGTDGTTVFYGTTHHSHFNYDVAENTFIRAGKAGATLFLNDSHNGPVIMTSGTGRVGIGNTTPNAKVDVAGGALVINSGLTNASVRPAVGSSRIKGEIASYSSSSIAHDDGFLRLSAGGGTTAIEKTYIELSGYSNVADMNKNIVFGVNGVERVRISNGGFVGE